MKHYSQRSSAIGMIGLVLKATKDSINRCLFAIFTIAFWMLTQLQTYKPSKTVYKNSNDNLLRIGQQFTLWRMKRKLQNL